jgi:hypothetical protein
MRQIQQVYYSEMLTYKALNQQCSLKKNTQKIKENKQIIKQQQ